MEFSLKWGESMKSHFNRFIGRELMGCINKPVEFDNPEIVFIYNVTDKDTINLSMQINPFFIYGRYNKLLRGIPQTHWPHKPCNGRGCEECNFTGKQYPDSQSPGFSQSALWLVSSAQLLPPCLPPVSHKGHESRVPELLSPVQHVARFLQESQAD